MIERFSIDNHLAVLIIVTAFASAILLLKKRFTNKGTIWKIMFVCPIACLAWLFMNNTLSMLLSSRQDQILLASLVLFTFSALIQSFIRRRCPDCGETNPHRVSSNEVDRWIGSKKVIERTHSGSGRNRREKVTHKEISVTFAKIQTCYQCKCGSSWIEEQKIEL